jgi:hypothetical protein
MRPMVVEPPRSKNRCSSSKAEGAGNVLGETALDQVTAQGLVLAVFRQAGLEEEAAEFT